MKIRKWTIPAEIRGEWGTHSVREELDLDSNVKTEDGVYETSRREVALHYAWRLRGSQPLGRCCDKMPRCRHFNPFIF